LMLRWLRPTDTITLDVDWLWRRLGPSVVVRMDRQSAGGGMMNRGQRAATRALQAVYRHHGPTGVLARSWPTGSMAFWAVLMLSAYLVFYYLWYGFAASINRHVRGRCLERLKGRFFLLVDVIAKRQYCRSQQPTKVWTVEFA
ncbi:MAG: hypothetical protein ABJH75_24840, partial [Roseibium sp.]